NTFQRIIRLAGHSLLDANLPKAAMQANANQCPLLGVRRTSRGTNRNVRFGSKADVSKTLGLIGGGIEMECAPFTYDCKAAAVGALLGRNAWEDRDEKNRTRCFGRCACTFIDVGERGVYEPQASHEGCHCCTATDCLHRRRMHSGSAWLPSRDGVYAGRN